MPAGRLRPKDGGEGKVIEGRLAAGADFCVIGRAAILHHDFPLRVQADPGFKAVPLPVTAEYLRNEGLGPAFVGYMGTWKGFVQAEPA